MNKTIKQLLLTNSEINMKLALLLYGTNPNSISVDINRQINSELGFFICPDIIDGVRYWCRYESWLYGDTRLIGYYE